jgi:hypothetical protein
MKIIMKCSVCGTIQTSEFEYDSLENFYANCENVDDTGLAHDADCGGTMTYELEG